MPYDAIAILASGIFIALAIYFGLRRIGDRHLEASAKVSSALTTLSNELGAKR